MEANAALPPSEFRETPILAHLRRLWQFLWPAKSELANIEVAESSELTFMGRVRKFLWLSSGLFSAASLAIPMIGYMAFGTFDGMVTNFVAAVVSAALFGLASFLHFGPDEA